MGIALPLEDLVAGLGAVETADGTRGNGVRQIGGKAPWRMQHKGNARKPDLRCVLSQMNVAD